MLVLIFTGTAYAEDNPFQGLTQEQVIQKYFEGRQLDTIEGIWLNDDWKPQIVIKSNLIDPSKKYGDYDYIMVEYSSKSTTKIEGINKTEYSSCFRIGAWHGGLRLTSVTTLMRNSGGYYGTPLYRFYTRIYPSEMKS
jgi:hypothetical protein